MPERPLVSVAIVSYNHRPYIEQTLDSVLAQKRDFQIEIVISDDCSPDGTGKLIDEFQARNANVFVRRDPERNLGPSKNFARVWEACCGKYVALVEGDDWWRQGKLAAQVEFMEAHPECTMSGHSVTFVDEDGNTGEDHPVGWPETSDIRLLIKGCMIPTPSAMYRRGVIDGLPAWAAGLGMGDWPLGLLHATRGKIGFINQPLAYYRRHAGGVWSPIGTKRKLEHMLEAAHVMRVNFPAEYNRLFEGAIGHIHFLLFQVHRKEGNNRAARRHLWRSCVHRFRGRELQLDLLYKVPLRMLNPSIG